MADQVLFRAINDILIYGFKKRKGYEPFEWYFSDEDNDIMEDGSFTFNYVCELLNINKVKSRLYLNWKLDLGKKKISENEYSTFLGMCSNE